jgi:RNA polymerase sigma-70 factor (ECF subfamily)
MSISQDPDSAELIRCVDRGDQLAVEQLLARHRDRLRQMVAVRIDPRMAARVDPSDVVQEALTEAYRKLPEYARSRPLAYYPWLRRIAWERLENLHARHLGAKGRSVNREARCNMALSDESVMQLADRLVASGTSPSMHLRRKELRCHVRDMLAQMVLLDREVLLLHYLEQLTFKEIADVLQITEGAAKMRHLRALERLGDLLRDGFGDASR